jgi:hypothetical protein
MVSSCMNKIFKWDWKLTTCVLMFSCPLFFVPVIVLSSMEERIKFRSKTGMQNNLSLATNIYLVNMIFLKTENSLIKEVVCLLRNIIVTGHSKFRMIWKLKLGLLPTHMVNLTLYFFINFIFIFLKVSVTICNNWIIWYN